MQPTSRLSNTVRFFVDPASIAAGSTSDADLLHQWQRVLRLRVGAELLLLDGAGMASHVVLTLLDTKKANWKIISTLPASGEPIQHLTICAALIRPERFEWLLQKSVEIGVTRIIPIICERTRAESSSTSNKFARWQRIVTEAAEQACRGKIPELTTALALKDIRTPQSDQVFWLHEGTGTLPLRQLLPTQPAPVWVISGPEGGFSPDEQHWLGRQPGWHATGLGSRILRAETAPIVAATVILATRGAYDEGAA